MRSGSVGGKDELGITGRLWEKGITQLVRHPHFAPVAGGAVELHERLQLEMHLKASSEHAVVSCNLSAGGI